MKVVCFSMFREINYTNIEVILKVLERQLESSTDGLKLDWSEVDQVEKEVLGAFVHFHSKAKLRGKSVVFCSLKEHILELVQSMRLDTIIHIRQKTGPN